MPTATPPESSPYCATSDGHERHKRVFSQSANHQESPMTASPGTSRRCHCRKYLYTEDFSSIKYRVDLKTVKEHVHKNLSNNRKAAALKAKTKLTDYQLAHHIVNSY